MAEETPGIQNKKLLIIALVLGGVVAIVYNIQMGKVRSAGRGEMVKLLQFRRDVEKGSVVDKEVLRTFEVPEKAAAALANFVTADKLGSIRDETISENVQKGAFLEWGHIIKQNVSSPSETIGEGMVAHTLAVDPRRVPGNLLRRGDRVHVKGMLPDPKGTLQSTYIIRGVRILAIAGKGAETTSAQSKSRTRNKAASSYGSITIEVTEEISLQLDNIISYVQGPVRIVVLNPNDMIPGQLQVDPSARHKAGGANPTAAGRQK